MTSKESKVAERILQNCHKPGLELKQLQLSENAITVVMELLERVNKGSTSPVQRCGPGKSIGRTETLIWARVWQARWLQCYNLPWSPQISPDLRPCPFEHLPSALKLGAVLVTDTMSQVTFKTFAGVFIVSFSGLEKQGMG